MTAHRSISQQEMETLLGRAEAALVALDQPIPADRPRGLKLLRLEELSESPPVREAAAAERSSDADLDVKIELGRARMTREEALKLHQGSVVPLDNLTDEPVDVYVNGRLVARGDVLVLNNNYCVRVTELVACESAAA